MASTVGADAGFIALSVTGPIGVAHATPSMPHAWRVEGDARTAVAMRR